jgi:hypothetical protein
MSQHLVALDHPNNHAPSIETEAKAKASGQRRRKDNSR